MSGQEFLYLLFFGLVAAWFIGRAMWRAYVLSSMRRVAAAATPAVEDLERTVARFYERFPVPPAARLPMDPDDYPAARPRKPSPSRPKTRRRKSGYRRRR